MLCEGVKVLPTPSWTQGYFVKYRAHNSYSINHTGYKFVFCKMHRLLIKILAGRDNVGLKNLADPEIPDLQSCMHGLPPSVCGGQLCRTKPRHRQLGARHCCQCAWCRHLPWRGRPCSSKPWLHSRSCGPHLLGSSLQTAGSCQPGWGTNNPLLVN